MVAELLVLLAGQARDIDERSFYMQSYRDINDSDYISDAPAVLNGNFKSIASDFRGASFPTTNLIEGMNCFRTDSSIMYQLDTDLKTWKPLYKVLAKGVEVEKAKNADIAEIAKTLIEELYANQTEAEAGSDTTKVMTAARVKDSIEKNSPKPIIATQAEAEAGTDNTKHMTPLRVLQSILKNVTKQDLSPYAKLASPAFTGTPTAPTVSKTTNNTQLATTAFVHALAGAVNNGGIIAQSLGQNGYVKFANGLILQWGLVTGNWSVNAYGSATIDVIFPIAFARAAYSINIISNEEHMACSIKSSPTKKGFSNSLWCSSGNTFTGTACWWVAVGE